MDAGKADAKPDSRGELLRQLRRLVGREGQEPEPMFGSQLSTFATANLRLDSRLSSGLPAVDRLLPGGGLRRGMLMEWVGSGVAQKWSSGVEEKNIHSSATPLLHYSTITLSLLAAREACREGGMMVVVDLARTFYPPAAAAWGIDLTRLIIVRPKNARDALWATVQSLRSPAVAAVWAALDRIDDRAFRRLQLAAQSARAIGLLSRPASARGQPTWADVRLGVKIRQGDWETGRQGRNDGKKASWSPSLLVPPPRRICDLSPSIRRVQIHLLRCRHGRSGGVAWLEIDDAAHAVREVSVHHDAHPLPVVAELADSAGVERSPRRWA
jgi:hypothetical protein